MEICAMLANGRKNREIAEFLCIEEVTAKTHITHILSKLGVSSRQAAAVWYNNKYQAD